MPHLKPKKDKKAVSKEEEQDSPKSTSNEERSCKQVNDGDKLLSLANTASKEATEASPPSVNHECKGDAPATREQQKVTPSPYIGGPPRGYEHPPFYGYESHPPAWMHGNPMYDNRVMGVYGAGARRLFPSPIRYHSKSDEDEGEEKKLPEEMSQSGNGGCPFRGPPSHGHSPYGPPGVPPYPGYPPRHYGYDELYSRPVAYAPHSPMKKRLQAMPTEAASPPKKSKQMEEEAKEDESAKPEGEDGVQDQLSPASTGIEETDSKQRIISPSSSIDATGKSNDEDSTSGAAAKGRQNPTAKKGDHTTQTAMLPRQQQETINSAATTYPAQYLPPPGPGMYGYPPHYHDGPHSRPPPPGHGWGIPSTSGYPTPPRQIHGPPPIYPPPPPPYPHTYGSPSRSLPYSQHGPTSALDTGNTIMGKKFSSSQTSTKSHSPDRPQHNDQSVMGPTIKSVAEWQREAIATGRAPSANRCMPLKAPIPSKYWGEAEKVKEAHIPDFHQLVNYPDYLTKMRQNVASSADSMDQDGKRHCVMCGKLRVCSASATNLSGGCNARRPKKNEDEDGEDGEDGESHIIPRQNKGLCTACDVTVWVFVETGLEIKWCKGCKNFRPWAAFGDKGLATKCVRCRDRQREKYALQKDELRLRRIRQGTNKQEEKKANEQHEIAAAKGLRDLMAASVNI